MVCAPRPTDIDQEATPSRCSDQCAEWSLGVLRPEDFGTCDRWACMHWWRCVGTMVWQQWLSPCLETSVPRNLVLWLVELAVEWPNFSVGRQRLGPWLLRLGTLGVLLATVRHRHRICPASKRFWRWCLPYGSPGAPCGHDQTPRTAKIRWGSMDVPFRGLHHCGMLGVSQLWQCGWKPAPETLGKLRRVRPNWLLAGAFLKDTNMISLLCIFLMITFQIAHSHNAHNANMISFELETHVSGGTSRVSRFPLGTTLEETSARSGP